MKKAMKDPYKVVLNQTKLPISLLNEKAKVLFESHLMLNVMLYKERVLFTCKT